MRHQHSPFLVAAVATAALATVRVGQAQVTVNNVPDWHQPCLIAAPNGPNNGANPGPGLAKYKAWCAPTAAADIMGFWSDVNGMNVADAAGYVSGALIAWNPPNPNNWQDNCADASSIPLSGTGLARAAGADLGWYLNTNDQGDQVGVPVALPNNGGSGAGEQFVGTKRVNYVQGLQNYLNARGYGASTVVRSATGVANIVAGWNNIVAEINAGRPLIGEFDHFNISPQGTPWGPEYEWSTPLTTDPQTGEDWSTGSGCGHATTIVGYIVGNVNVPHKIIVQDNRRYIAAPGGLEAINFKAQIILPFMTVAGAAASPWYANISITVAAAAQPVTVANVPDWHQPCLIGAPNGPDNGANPVVGAANYKAWCSPTAAADVIGWWQDVKRSNVADGRKYVSGGVIGWNPPNPRNWQDDCADAGSIPIRGNGLARAAGQDLAWYMNTNDQGNQVGLPNNGGGAGGEQFVGTKRVNIVPGIQRYLAVHGYGGSIVARSAQGVANIAAGWANIVAEINAGRPLLAEFDHFNIVPVGSPNGPDYDWSTPTSSDSQTGEIWNSALDLGHTTTIVGYILGNAGTPNKIIVQDNRRYLTAGGVAEANNVRAQIRLPFSTVAGAALAPWNSNISIQVKALFVIPTPIDPGRFRVYPYASLDLPPMQFYSLAVSDGLGGYPPGLMIATGPAADRTDLLLVDPTGTTVTTFRSNLVSSESMVWGRPPYPPMLLVSEIWDGRVKRIGPVPALDAVFAYAGFSPTMGPAQMSYGPTGTAWASVLFANDYTSGMVMRIEPSGTVVPLIGVEPNLDGLAEVVRSRYNGDLLMSTYNPEALPETGRIWAVDLDSMAPIILADGLNGLRLMTPSPGGQWGEDVFIGVDRTGEVDSDADGGVFTISPTGQVAPFLTGIDGSHVVFDTAGILGGGMFVCDSNQFGNEGRGNKIWHVLPICTVADIVSIGGLPPADGILTGDDFVAFINAFAAEDLLADIVSIGGLPPSDGLLTGDDFNAFINAFVEGCPQ